MKVLVFGKSGQVAQSLLDLAGPSLEIVALGRADADLSQPNDLTALVRSHRPNAIINAAAYTAVDKAEEETVAAFSLNSDAVRRIGVAAEANNLPVVHISTDYVFKGDGTSSWRATDATGPLGVYGASKLSGEGALAEVCNRYATLRTSWVFSQYGNNFVKTMLRLGKERDSLNVVGDQIGGPTSAADIAQTCIEIARNLAGKTNIQSGVWHYSGQDDCSWADFATEIFRQAKISCEVNAIPTSDYPTPATRPLNSRLDCATTKRDFDIDRPIWKDSLAKILLELGET